MKDRNARIGFLSRHPAPYRDSFLARISNSERLKVSVFSEQPYDEGHAYWDLPASVYDTEILAPKGRSQLLVLLLMIKRIVFGGFDYTFWPGFMTLPILVSEFVAAVLGKKYVICSDAVCQRSTSWWRRCLKKYLIKHATAIMVGGNAGKAFFKSTYNVPDDKLLEGVYSLDGIELEKRIDNIRRGREGLRTRMGIGASEIIYLMVANMLPKRHYPITVAAFRTFAKSHPDCRFVICGRGDGLNEMQDIARTDSSIIVVPGLPFNDMLELYAMADVYVHGGMEPASTALQIGAIAKLPLLTSKAIGFAWDLLVDEETGIEVKDFKDQEQWIHGFSHILDMRTRWREMGTRARELSRKLDSDVVAEGFVDYFAKPI